LNPGGEYIAACPICKKYIQYTAHRIFSGLPLRFDPSPRPTLPFGMFFSCEHRVSYSECTLGNHIYHSRYLDLLERARGEFFRALGQSLATLQEQDLVFPVIQCRLLYKRPARYDDVLRIQLALTELTRLRLTFTCEVTRPSDSAIILRGETMHIAASIQEKPKRMPEPLVQLMRKYLMPEQPSLPSRRRG
jgi:acyl-CoA thioester hydrolase